MRLGTPGHPRISTNRLLSFTLAANDREIKQLIDDVIANPNSEIDRIPQFKTRKDFSRKDNRRLLLAADRMVRDASIMDHRTIVDLVKALERARRGLFAKGDSFSEAFDVSDLLTLPLLPYFTEDADFTLYMENLAFLPVGVSLRMLSEMARHVTSDDVAVIDKIDLRLLEYPLRKVLSHRQILTRNVSSPRRTQAIDKINILAPNSLLGDLGWTFPAPLFATLDRLGRSHRQTLYQCFLASELDDLSKPLPVHFTGHHESVGSEDAAHIYESVCDSFDRPNALSSKPRLLDLGLGLDGVNQKLMEEAKSYLAHNDVQALRIVLVTCLKHWDAAVPLKAIIDLLAGHPMIDSPSHLRLQKLEIIHRSRSSTADRGFEYRLSKKAQLHLAILVLQLESLAPSPTEHQWQAFESAWHRLSNRD